MAVITKYVVVRNGVELDRVFEDRKEAEAYDAMLDAADNLSAFIKNSGLQVAIEPAVIDDIAIHLAKNAGEVSRILKGVKTLKPKAAAKEPAADDGGQQAAEKKSQPQKSGPKARQK